MILLVGSLVLAGLLATVAAPQTAPVLPTSVDTFTVRYGTTVLGRGIMQRCYRRGELVQVYAWRSALDGSWSLDSLFLDGASLRTRLDILVSGDTIRVAEYPATAVAVRTRGGPKGVTTQSVVVPTGTHSAAAAVALAAAMPFSAGASRTISSFYSPPSQLGIVQNAIRVVGRETVNGRATWRVAVDTPGGGTVFWIDALSRAVLQFDTREGDALITFRRYGGLSAVGPDGWAGVAVGRRCVIVFGGAARPPLRLSETPPQQNATLAGERAVAQSSKREVATCVPNLTPSPCAPRFASS